MDKENRERIKKTDKKELDNFEEWVKEFWGELDLDNKKEKKKNILYCNCNFPKTVKRGFSHIVYDFCMICKKEVMKE